MNAAGGIMQAARVEQGLTIEEFRAVLRRGMATGISHGKAQMWLAGAVSPNYEEMYYLRTHTPDTWVREMAGQVMAALRPDLTADQEPELPGPVSDTTNK